MKLLLLIIVLLLGGCAYVEAVKDKIPKEEIASMYCGEGNAVEMVTKMKENIIILCNNGSVSIENYNKAIYVKYFNKVVKILDYFN